MLKAWVSLAPLLSVALTMKFDVPVAVGDPLMLPVLDSESPDGR
jgi:hypothetical protein